MSLSLFILLVVTAILLFSSQRKDSLPSFTATPSVSPVPTAVIEKSPDTTSPTLSYGLFYPFADGIVINNSQPTILGKLPQVTTSYLSTRFGPEQSPISGETDNFLRFIPGRTINLQIKIDDILISPVFGIPQYPTVQCRKVNHNPDGTISYNPITGEKSPPDDIYSSQASCLSNMSTALPPIVFFAKPPKDLSPGSHILTILSGEEVLGSLKFTIDPNFSLGAQTPRLVNSSGFTDYFGSTDSCLEGYYYDSNYLRVPLPTNNNPNLYYGISFPQSQEEYGSISERKVQIGFEGKLFDLFFPQSSIYFEGKSFGLGFYQSEGLFLPKDHLFFTDNKPARPFHLPSDPSNNTRKYFEIFPVDLSGREYQGYSLPWSVTGSSGCDG